METLVEQTDSWTSWAGVVLGILFGGGALTAFGSWLVIQLIALRVRVAKVEAEVAFIKVNCSKHSVDMAEVFSRLTASAVLLSEMHGWMKGRFSGPHGRHGEGDEG